MSAGRRQQRGCERLGGSPPARVHACVMNSFSMLALLFARRRLAPEAISHLTSCCHRGHVGDQSSWTGGQMGSKVDKVKPRAAAREYFHYLLIRKSRSQWQKLFLSLFVTLDEKWCNWSPAALSCQLSRCFHGPEEGMQNMSSRASVRERVLFLASADQCFCCLVFLQGIAPP